MKREKPVEEFSNALNRATITQRNTTMWATQEVAEEMIERVLVNKEGGQIVADSMVFQVIKEAVSNIQAKKSGKKKGWGDAIEHVSKKLLKSVS